MKYSTSMLAGAILTLGVLHSCDALGAQCQFLGDLSPYQQDVAYQAYRAGQPYDLGLTAVAIAWQESKLGVYKVRFGDGIDKSVGVGHTVIKYKTKGMDSFHKGMWMQSMIENDAKSIGVMVGDILYWQARFPDSWYKGVGAYNGGNIPNNQYASSVSYTVKMIKNCKF